MIVEKYSHVMHLVSNVRGTAGEGVSNAEIVKACISGWYNYGLTRNYGPWKLLKSLNQREEVYIQDLLVGSALMETSN